MPKSTKIFVINDNSLNEFGFRIITEGVDLSQFEKNPILLYSHFRPWKGTKDEILPLGYMTDIKVEGDKILGTPFFDDKDEFAMSIFEKVEAGILRMVSGGFKALKWSDEPADLLPGQTGSTLLKSQLREVSICDIGGNNNALALCDDNDELVALSDKNKLQIIPLLNNTKTTDMTELKDIAKKLNLAENTALDVVLSTIENLQTKNTALETEVQQLKNAKSDGEIDAKLAEAVTKGKITAAQVADYKELSAGKLEVLNKLLDSMPEHVALSGQVKETSDEINVLKKLSWDDLDAKDKLEELKAKDLDCFKLKYKEKFNKEYAG